MGCMWHFISPHVLLSSLELLTNKLARLYSIRDARIFETWAPTRLRLFKVRTAGIPTLELNQAEHDNHSDSYFELIVILVHSIWLFVYHEKLPGKEPLFRSLSTNELVLHEIGQTEEGKKNAEIEAGGAFLNHAMETCRSKLKMELGEFSSRASF